MQQKNLGFSPSYLYILVMNNNNNSHNKKLNNNSSNSVGIMNVPWK